MPSKKESIALLEQMAKMIQNDPGFLARVAGVEDYLEAKPTPKSKRRSPGPRMDPFTDEHIVDQPVAKNPVKKAVKPKPVRSRFDIIEEA